LLISLREWLVVRASSLCGTAIQQCWPYTLGRLAPENCAFRVFRYQKGSYEKIPETDMVQQFGFVHSTTNSLPDLVTWSHGSAFDSGGALWQFGGESYQQICTWLLTSRKENEHGEWVDVRL
jgi:hypothetical protein